MTPINKYNYYSYYYDHTEEINCILTTYVLIYCTTNHSNVYFHVVSINFSIKAQITQIFAFHPITHQVNISISPSLSLSAQTAASLKHEGPSNSPRTAKILSLYAATHQLKHECDLLFPVAGLTISPVLLLLR